MFIVGTVIAFNDPNLLRGEAGGVAYSPFTLVFQRIPVVGPYAARFDELRHPHRRAVSRKCLALRVLPHAAGHGRPGRRARLLRQAQPARRAGGGGVGHGGLVGALAFLASTVGEQKIYQMLYNASGLTGFIIWLGIAICHLRFRRAWAAQGRTLDQLKFRALLPCRPLAGAGALRCRGVWRQRLGLPGRRVLVV